MNEPTNLIAPPPGTVADDWQQHSSGQRYRLTYGASRAISGRDDVVVQTTAVQLGDGSIDHGVIEPPGVHIYVGGDPLTVAQARVLAATVMAAADDLDRASLHRYSSSRAL